MRLVEAGEQPWLPIVHQIAKTFARRISRQDKAFDNCKRVCTALVDALHQNGFEASLVKVGEPQKHWPQAHLTWQAMDPFYWVHYVVKIGDQAVDLTRRQFDPKAPVITIEPWSQIQQDWGNTHAHP
jgi:hypothetical protein